MAKKIRKAAGYEGVRPSGLTPPPLVTLSGFYHCAFGYRVVRPQGAGSWLLFYTVAGTGLLRQPGLDLPQRAGDVALLAPRAYSDYGVPFRSGVVQAPLVSAAAAGRYARRLPDAVARMRDDPTGRYIRQLHLDARKPWPDPRRGWRFHWIHFQPRPAWEAGAGGAWPRLRAAGPGLYAGQLRAAWRRARAAAAFARIHVDLLAAGAGGEALAATAMEELFLLLDQEARGGRRPVDPRVSAALERIGKNLAGPHAVAGLARAAALSPSRFAHLFKAQTGASVAQTVIRLRVAQARRMLAHTEERIAEIAYALGFCSPYYFSQQFKAQTGLSPRAFRRKVRGTEG